MTRKRPERKGCSACSNAPSRSGIRSSRRQTSWDCSSTSAAPPSRRWKSSAAAVSQRRTTSPVPSLESLKIHLKIYNCRGGINPVLLANPAYAGWLSHPRLRKLALSGTYEQFQFGSNFFCDPYNLEFQPSFAPLLNYAQLFAETLDVLALEIRNVDDEYTSDNDNDNHDEEWTGEFNSQDYDPGEYGLNLTIPFPSLCQLALRSTKTAVGVRLCSLDKTRFPGLKSCLCDISPASPGGAAPDLEYFADRIPGLKVAAVSGEVDSLTQRVAGWIRERDAEQAPERDNYRREKPTWPQPLRPSPKNPDPIALRETPTHG